MPQPLHTSHDRHWGLMMDVALGVACVVLGLLAWGGQTLTVFDPTTAARWGLAEHEVSVDPVFWADIRAEATWDVVTLWPMVVAGALLLSGSDSWVYFGLVAGGIYVYFAGRGILARVEMRRRGMRIGKTSSVRLGLIMLGVWGALGLAVIASALVDLETL